MDSSENQILSWYQTTYLVNNFRKDLLSNLFAPAKIWLSQTYQKWEEERRKRNDYRLSLPSFFTVPPPPFRVPVHFRQEHAPLLRQKFSLETM